MIYSLFLLLSISFFGYLYYRYRYQIVVYANAPDGRSAYSGWRDAKVPKVGEDIEILFQDEQGRKTLYSFRINRIKSIGGKYRVDISVSTKILQDLIDYNRWSR